MSEWTPEVIHFMEDAEQFTSYFDHLAAIVRDHAPAGGRVADLGCGMGQLSFALADYARTVDAVDSSPRAAAYVRARAAREGGGAVVGVLGDMRDLQPERPYDAMAFCLSASIEDALAIAARHCTGTAVVVNKIQSKMDARRTRAGEGPVERDRRPLVYDFEQTLVDLAAHGLCFEGRELSVDYGQPFRTLADAQLYFSLFRTRSYPDGVTERQLAHLLDETGDDEFPYHLPVRRHLAVYALDTEQARAQLGCRLESALPLSA